VIDTTHTPNVVFYVFVTAAAGQYSATYAP
jgi:hypothetical protein